MPRLYFLLFFQNPTYDSNTYFHDIGLIFLSSNVTLNNYVQTACLPPFQSSTIPAASLTGVTVGWGTNSLTGSRPGYLSNVGVDIYSETACIGFGYDPKQGFAYNSSIHVCAGSLSIFKLLNIRFFKFLKDIFFIKVT